MFPEDTFLNVDLKGPKSDDAGMTRGRHAGDLGSIQQKTYFHAHFVNITRAWIANALCGLARAVNFLHS